MPISSEIFMDKISSVSCRYILSALSPCSSCDEVLIVSCYRRHVSTQGIVSKRLETTFASSRSSQQLWRGRWVYIILLLRFRLLISALYQLLKDLRNVLQSSLEVLESEELLHNVKELCGDVWKEFVMYSRLGLHVPEHLKQYNQASVLIGPVLMANETKVQRIVGGTRDFKNLQFHRLSNGSVAMQHCLEGPAFFELLNEQVRMWWEIIEPPSGK